MMNSLAFTISSFCAGPNRAATFTYLELQNNRAFFNRKSSLFRGNSPLSLKIPPKDGVCIAIPVLVALSW